MFVLTHYDHDSIEMAGGTTFHFVTDGFDAALGRARDAGGEQDSRIAGGRVDGAAGAGTGAIDDMCLGIVPVGSRLCA